MIKIKSQKDYLVALESVAMTDIVLNMFIFFFISFSLLYTFNPNTMSRIEVSLPKATSAVSLDGTEKTILAINENGEYFLDDIKINDSELKEGLKSKIKEGASVSLLLKVDSAARFDCVARALDVVNELDIKKVSIATAKNKF